MHEVLTLDDDPLWYKDAIIYELHVRAFRDSNGDGIGDFPGVVQKLDYLQDLGVTALWLLPFYPSPLRDDGYDIADYTDVNPIYGTLADFKVLLDEAHRRGLRVLTELVLNHTSDQHPWFQRARRAPPGSPERDFYVWSDTGEEFKEARIIFKDFEPSNWTWDPVARAYYWHRFYSHQPDLNFDNPQVHEAVFRVLEFWLEMGVDAFRLDAVPYLYEREGTNCENLPPTHAFLKKLRAHVDHKYPRRMLLAEANQWPEDAAAYFGGATPDDGPECNMCFHFPVMPRLFMAIQMEDRYPIVDILQQTPAIPEQAQWALFLRNHDELTLEMVTEDDRDYMYRVYAHDPQARINLGIRRRLAPLLQNHRGKIELMNGLLLSLPGTPVVYYGDEIGMGDNIYLGDRNGVRTPMQWNAERNAGFSSANPQRLYLPVVIDPEFHYEALNVEAQQNNVHSLLWWTKRMLALRKKYQAFGRGTLEMLTPDNHKTLAFVRRWRGEHILVVANLSRFVQCLRVDLSAFKGMRPIEMLGRTEFPVVGDEPYFMILGGYAFYWFVLTPRPEPARAAAEPPLIGVADADWAGVFLGKARPALEEALPAYLRDRPWFQGRLRYIKGVTVRDTVPLGAGAAAPHLTVVQVDYAEGDPEQYLLALAFAPAPRPGAAENAPRGPVIARLALKARGEGEAEQGALYDPSGERGFVEALMGALTRGGGFAGTAGVVVAEPLPDAPAEPVFADGGPHEVRVVEMSNTSVVVGDRLVLKLYRRLEEGVHPEVEVKRALEEQTSFRHAPRLLGTLVYHPEAGEPVTLAVDREYVPSESDAWRMTLDAVRLFFDRVVATASGPPDLEAGPRSLVDLSEREVPALVAELLGSYAEMTRLMARRTAEMHVALASVADPAFTPEPFTSMYQRSLYQSMRGRIRHTLQLLRVRLGEWPAPLREQASRVVGSEDRLLRLARRVLDRKVVAPRIRCHGHLRLRHLLFTGKDFLVIDFEGEAERSFSHRRRKRSPLRDLVSLHRSLQEAALAALTHGGVRGEDTPTLLPWARFWQRWAAVVFLKEYRATPGAAALLPADPAALLLLLDFYRIGWNVSGLYHELAAPSERAGMYLRNLLQVLDEPIGEER
jgi:maltose alpha-D-glucosyltransferase/alpha-amylase